MTPLMDDLEKLAREALAGMLGCAADPAAILGAVLGRGSNTLHINDALAAIKSAILAERERCAGVVERWACSKQAEGAANSTYAAINIAAAIRQR